MKSKKKKTEIVQTTKPKIWKRKGHLTKKAKAYLSYKIKQFYQSPEGIALKEKRRKHKVEEVEEIEEAEEPELQEFIYSVKLIYESPRDSHHDIITECNLKIIAEKEPSQEEVQQLAVNNIDEFTEFGVPYSEAVIGLVSSEPTTDAPTWKIEEVNYSHNLGRPRSNKSYRKMQRTLK